MKTISVVIPAYNEEKNIERSISAVSSVVHPLSQKYFFEFVVVDDGSKDKTSERVGELAKNNKTIKLIQFTRNFGKEIALTAGIINATGDAVIMIDADGQQPAELIPRFLEAWEKGAPVVVAVRNSHKGEGIVKRTGSYLFYKIMSWMSETEIVPYSTDFRLLDREVVESFKLLEERSRITRGLIDWLGYDTTYIQYDSNKREDSKPGYSFIKLMRLALTSFATHSLFPLKVVGYLGFFMTILSFIFGVFVFLSRYVFHTVWSLSLTDAGLLAILLVFLVSIILACLGFIALYIGNIQVESFRRPHFVIRKKVNFMETK